MLAALGIALAMAMAAAVWEAEETGVSNVKTP